MRLLITGGSGNVGRRLRREFAGEFELIRIFDRIAADDLRANEEMMTGDLASLADLEAAMVGMDAVLHLAGANNERAFEEILQSNIVGTWNVYEAAFRMGVKRVVFGSSNHAVGFYPRSERIGAEAPCRPDTRYGLSKCWGEDVGALYADKYGVKSLHIRIGNVFDLPGSERALALWISARDLAQLVRIGLTHPDIHNTVVFGISRNSRAWYDNAPAFALGYRPQDSADDHLAHAMEMEKSVRLDAVGRHFQGGPFCSMEYAGPPVPEQ